MEGDQGIKDVLIAPSPVSSPLKGAEYRKEWLLEEFNQYKGEFAWRKH